MRKPLSCLFALGLVFFLGAGVASAQFMASDLVYIPAAAHNDGANDSHWRTDVFVTNVDTVAVDLAFFFLPTGTTSNLGYFVDRQYGFGGRDDEGWGHVDSSLADVQPGATVSLDDIIAHEDSNGKTWLDDYGSLAGVGAIVVFAYEAGTLDADGGPTPRNVVVMSRTYSASTDGTYGQLMPGIPWYNMADASAVNDQHDLSYVLLPGAREDTAFRYNLGILNASDDQTTIQVKVEVFKADGSAYTDDTGAALAKVATLGPLAHIQFNSILSANFGLSDVSDVLIKVSFLSWTSTSPDPVPMFTAYGTLVDNGTNDATTILPSFGFPYDINCVWGSTTGATALNVAHTETESPRLRRRPVKMPPL
ncbi:MAG: hypothetical protein LJE95_16550 [Acidobacteria bacterium]|nr:hypothetical protein [Acidobacteriota bacterium]